MEKLSRKESMAIATIHDALRELRHKGMHAIVDMRSQSISIKCLPDTEKEAMQLKKILFFFKDEDDDIVITHFPPSEVCSEFYKVALTKKMV